MPTYVTAVRLSVICKHLTKIVQENVHVAMRYGGHTTAISALRH